ncbi:hypothetical protein BDZ94DRAFT_1283902 [Collybia nuda]|uniref:Uncharacterized protein n=1 Tax=Collybia nuda TaxID=64659 RepID=A0A9P5Y0Q4_9AGAR|nr:hypothetical protein BDZ94DRAFT_1283902 [Collybia nuda]
MKSPTLRSRPITSLPSPRVPTEIIDRILEFALAFSSSTLHVPDFGSIASVTLASVNFRQIALRQYFHHVTLETRLHWKGLFSLLEVQECDSRYTPSNNMYRSLCASSKILSYNPTRLNYLNNLHTLSIDFAQEGLSTQHPCIKSLLENLELASISLKLTSLTLSNLPRIDVVLLKLIARSFPRLMDLYLSCTERLEFSCCWSCFEDSLGCTIHSPIPDDYFEVSDLASAFACALKPLTCLTHLHLGIFLSDDQLLYAHIAHSLGDEENMGLVDNSGQLEDVRTRELKASIVIAQKLKAIKSIGWSSFFTGMPGPSKPAGDVVGEPVPKNDASSGDCGDNETENSEITKDMKTTIWVLRTNGRVRVRRTPW